RVVIYYMRFLYDSDDNPLKIIAAIAFLAKMKDKYCDKIIPPLSKKAEEEIKAALYISRYIRYRKSYYLDKAISTLDFMYKSIRADIIKFFAIGLRKNKVVRRKLIERIEKDYQQNGGYSLKYHSSVGRLILLARLGFYKDVLKFLKKGINYYSHEDELGSLSSFMEFISEIDTIGYHMGASIISKIYKGFLIKQAKKYLYLSIYVKDFIINQTIQYGDFADFYVLERNWHDPKDKKTLILALSNIVYRLRKLDASKGIILRGKHYSKERFEFLLNNCCKKIYKLISKQPKLDDDIIIALGKTGSKECINKLHELIDSSDNSINTKILDAAIYSMDKDLINKAIQKFIEKGYGEVFNYEYPGFVAKLISEDNLIEMIKAFDRLLACDKNVDDIEELLFKYAKLKKRWDIIEKILDGRLNQDEFYYSLRMAIYISPDKAAEYLIRNEDKIKSINRKVLMLCVYKMMENNNPTADHLIKNIVVTYNLSDKINDIVLSSGNPSAFKFLYQNAHILAKDFKVEDKEILKFIPQENIIQPALEVIKSTRQEDHLKAIMNVLMELGQGDIMHKIIKTITTNSPDHPSISELIISLSKFTSTINDEMFLV
ncbi:MAG: hypothetical protein NZM04_00815, partial [Methylacidiphilales bacterium]|nr:hypothetical protein [Candidatus Methylacidiphilales bacterium]